MQTLAFLIDPVETLNLETETSLLFIDEFLHIGHQVLWIEPQDLVLRDAELVASARRVLNVSPIEFEAAFEFPLGAADAVLLRPDPPFNTAYLHMTYLLDHLPGNVVQINRASSVRSYNEKLLPLRWPHLCPRTLVTRNPQELATFLKAEQDIVVKPLDNCSGRGITRLDARTKGIAATIEELFRDANGEPRYLMAQEFLSDVSEGDKRVFLVGGKPVGAVNRIPAKGSYLANIHQGASCYPTKLTARETRAIATIAPFLMSEGLFLAGVDFIGDQMTEINVTSPSALRQINEVTGQDTHKLVVKEIMSYIASENDRVNNEKITQTPSVQGTARPKPIRQLQSN